MYHEGMDNFKQCPQCRVEGIGPKPAGEFYKNSTRGDGLSPLCVTHHILDTKVRAEQQRRKAIDLLGGKCSDVRCAVAGGMADVRCLQFDHINGRGNERQRAGENLHTIVKAILGGSQDFQVLCANCNWIKKHERAEHVGERIYNRDVPTERKQGVGKGRAPGQQDAVKSWWDNATPEQKAERIAKSSAGRKGRPNPKVAEARRGTKLVDGHWVRDG